jgi:hypothetical protein
MLKFVPKVEPFGTEGLPNDVIGETGILFKKLLILW